MERKNMHLSISVHHNKSSVTSLSDTSTGKIPCLVCLIEFAFVVTVWIFVNWNKILEIATLIVDWVTDTKQRLLTRALRPQCGSKQDCKDNLSPATGMVGLE